MEMAVRGENPLYFIRTTGRCERYGLGRVLRGVRHCRRGIHGRHHQPERWRRADRTDHVTDLLHERFSFIVLRGSDRAHLPDVRRDAGRASGAAGPASAYPVVSQRGPHSTLLWLFFATTASHTL